MPLIAHPIGIAVILIVAYLAGGTGAVVATTVFLAVIAVPIWLVRYFSISDQRKVLMRLRPDIAELGR